MELHEFIAARRAVLVIIDLQNDYCHPEGEFARLRGDEHLSWVAEVAPRVAGAARTFREAGDPVVFLRTHHYPSVMSDAYLGRYQDEDALMFCQPGSWGAEHFHVQPEPEDLVVTKHRYAGFYGTPLEILLRNMQRDVIVLAGFSTNVCVETTAREACVRDFRVVVLEDCCACTSVEEHSASIKTLRTCFGQVREWRELEDAWA